MVYLDINFTNLGYVTATLHSIGGTQLVSKGYFGDIKDNWDISQLAPGHYTLSIVGESFHISRTITITE